MKNLLRSGVQLLGPICHRFRHWGVPALILRRFRKPVPLGLRGEQAARKYLQRAGWQILATRSQELVGELDLVAVDQGTVVFVEVKTRRSAQAGLPVEAVDDRKQRQLARLALVYLKRHRLLGYPVRFDVIGLTWPETLRRPEIRHVRGAFSSPLEDQLWG